MQTASSEIKMQSLLLRLVMSKGQKSVADHLGVAESHISRWISGEAGLKLEQYLHLLLFLDIKLVSNDPLETSVILPCEYVHALKVLAQAALTD